MATDGCVPIIVWETQDGEVNGNWILETELLSQYLWNKGGRELTFSLSDSETCQNHFLVDSNTISLSIITKEVTPDLSHAGEEIKERKQLLFQQVYQGFISAQVKLPVILFGSPKAV